jgi:hypothetical protein
VERLRHPLPRRADREGQGERRVRALGDHALHLLAEGQHAHPLGVAGEPGEQLARQRGGGRARARAAGHLVGQVVVDVEEGRGGLRVRGAVRPAQRGAASASAK